MRILQTHTHRSLTRLVEGPDYILLKRIVDVVLAATLLLILAPLMLLIALAIKLHSPGPVFYRQQRIGRDGKPFMMLKFRSMRCGADTGAHREHVRRLIQADLGPADVGAMSLKLRCDSRITGVGRLLRRSSLDELPQLLNVLYGEMSLVGPRPPLPYEYEMYEAWQQRRLDVTPGITGLWQVIAHNTVPFSQMVAIDLDYIERMSLWLDLWIMVRTPFAMFDGQ